MFAPLGIDVRLHTAVTSWPARNKFRRRKPDTTVDSPLPAPNSVLVIGTHALTESTFSLPNLVIGYHRRATQFGVVQREKLVRKGRYPHLLVMTATPIHAHSG